MGIDRSKIETLLSKDVIAKRVAELGKQITKDYAGQEVICVCILKGSILFFSDLVRELNLPVEFDFIRASSYGNELSSSGDVKITKDLSGSISDKHVLVVEDIVDTGITLNFLLDLFKSRNPKSLKLCALLQKPANKVKDVKIDYLGFTIENHYVVGYGLDAAERYRNLDYVGVYKE